MASVGFSETALATDRTWDNGGTNGVWTSANNWNPNGVPVEGDNVTLTSAATDATITIDADVVRLGSLTINGYTGILTGGSAGRRVSVTGNFLQSTGTFRVPSRFTVGGSFSRTGGTFDSATYSSVVVLNPTAAASATITSSFSTLRLEDTTETGLVAYLKFDDLSGTTTKDWSGAATAQTGTMVDLATWTSSNLPTAISFDNVSALSLAGTDDCVSLAAPTSLPANNAAQTIAIWFKYADEGSLPLSTPMSYSAGGRDLVNLNTTGSAIQVGMWHAEMRVWQSGGGDIRRLCGTRANPDVSTDTNYTNNLVTDYPAVDTWHHFVYTYDPSASSEKHKCYLNGVLMPNNQTNVAAQTSTPTDAAVGCRESGTSYNEEYLGQLDDVRIYSVTLSAEEIAALAAGRYPNRGGTATVTLGANTTVDGTFAIDSGTLNTSTFTLNAAATDATMVAFLNAGGLTVGSGTITFNGGFTVRDFGTLTMNDASGIVRIGAGKTFTMDGTLDSSTAGSATVKSVSGNYAFKVGSTATATPVLNIDGLAVQNTDTDGMYINAVAGSVTTFTKFDNLAFSSGTGNNLLRIYSPSLFLVGQGLTFDASTTYNVRVAGNGTGDGETRLDLGNVSCTTSPCESNDQDDDADDNGVGDNGGDAAVAHFFYQAHTDTAGAVEGYPTAAFNWNTFEYWNTYVAFNNYVSGTHRLFARTVDGAARYSWDIPSGQGTFKGTPRWDMEGSNHYVYLVTSAGYVYKLQDTGSVLSVASGWPYHNGGSASATTTLAWDENNLYWAGNDSGGAKKMFSLTLAKVLNGTKTVAADIVAEPSVAPVGASKFLFGATSGAFYKIPVDWGAETTSTQPSSAVNGWVQVASNRAYFAESNGTVWALDTSDLSTVWSYQYHAEAVKHLCVDPSTGRAYYGDADGHVFVTAAGAPVSGYPAIPTGGTSSDAIETAPLVREGIVVYGTTTGKVFVVDESASGTARWLQMYHVGSAVSTISYVKNGSTGKYMVATANGRFFFLDKWTDPTP